MRVLKWMLDRIAGKAGGDENVFGVTPRYDDLPWDGIEFSADAYARITSIEIDAWQAELALHDELFDKLRHRLPAELEQVKARIAQRLAS